MDIDVLTLFPPAFDWFRDPAPRGERARAGLHADVRRLPRPHAAARGAGGRHAVRRRRRHGPARGRRGSGAAGALRHRPGGSRPRPPGRRADPGRAAARRRLRGRARGGARADAPVRALRGLRRARPRALLHGPAVDRPLRHRGRGAGRDGGVRRGAAQAPGRARARGLRRRGVVLAGAGGPPGVSALHPAGRLARVDRARRPAERSPRPHPRVAAGADRASAVRRRATRTGRKVARVSAGATRASRRATLRYHRRARDSRTGFAVFLRP